MSKFVKKIFVVSLVFAFALSLTACGVNITSVGLPTETALNKGETQQLAVSYGTDDEATEDKINEAAAKLTLEWVSSDENVVTVDQAGLVTAIGPGEADVTVSIKDGNIQSVCHIVVQVPLTNLSVEDSIGLVLNATDSAELEAKMTPDDATDVTLTYSSTDEAVATIDSNGKVAAVGAGECDIVVTGTSCDGKTIEAKTAVKVDVAPESLSLEDATLTINKSGTLDVTAAGEGITVGTQYTWISSDESIVTVDDDGNIQGVGIGSATITVTNELGQTASCEVTVKNIVCAYCGQEGHGSGSCPKKAADEEAARVAAQQQAAAAAAGGAGAGGAGGAAGAAGATGGATGGSSGGSSSGGGFEAVPGGGQVVEDDGSVPPPGTTNSNGGEISNW